MATDIAAIATACTAASNSGSAGAVASFHAPDGHIVINRGTPWKGRAGITAMAAGFFADVPDLRGAAHRGRSRRPPSGRKKKVRCCPVMRAQGGKVVKGRNSASIARKLNLEA